MEKFFEGTCITKNNEIVFLKSKFSKANFERYLNDLPLEQIPKEIDIREELKRYKEKTGKTIINFENRIGFLLKKANPILFNYLVNKWRKENIDWSKYNSKTVAHFNKLWNLN